MNLQLVVERYPCNRLKPDNSLVITARILASSIILLFLLKPKSPFQCSPGEGQKTSQIFVSGSSNEK